MNGLQSRWWVSRFREIRALLLVVIVELACLIALVVAAMVGYHG